MPKELGASGPKVPSPQMPKVPTPALVSPNVTPRARVTGNIQAAPMRRHLAAGLAYMAGPVELGSASPIPTPRARVAGRVVPGASLYTRPYQVAIQQLGWEIGRAVQRHGRGYPLVAGDPFTSAMQRLMGRVGGFASRISPASVLLQAGGSNPDPAWVRERGSPTRATRTYKDVAFSRFGTFRKPVSRRGGR